MSEVRLIKKYSNRRLYDATQSRHITLEDIRALIVSGEQVKVVEDKSGEDITRAILLQVIADQEQFGRPMLSTPLLEALIRFYGNSLQSFLSTYLEKSVETFMQQHTEVHTRLAEIMSTTPLQGVAELTRHNLELWAKMQESLFGAFTATSRESRNGSAATSNTQEHDEPRG
ncbi:MAG: polyhydroxyalkanoate synthesis repressor PhaR [Steroidobacteraceae bacterium]